MPTQITKELIAGTGLAVERKTIKLRNGEYLLDVRKLNSDEHIAVVELRAEMEDKGERESLGAMVQLVLLVCVDTDGKQIFEAGEEALVAKTFSLDDMTEIITAASGMEADALAGKSEPSSAATA